MYKIVKDHYYLEKPFGQICAKYKKQITAVLPRYVKLMRPFRIA